MSPLQSVVHNKGCFLTCVWSVVGVGGKHWNKQNSGAFPLSLSVSLSLSLSLSLFSASRSLPLHLPLPLLLFPVDVENHIRWKQCRLSVLDARHQCHDGFHTHSVLEAFNRKRLLQ